MIVYDYVKSLDNRSMQVIDKITDLLQRKFKLKNIWNQSIYNILSVTENKKEYDFTIKELIDRVASNG